MNSKILKDDRLNLSGLREDNESSIKNLSKEKERYFYTLELFRRRRWVDFSAVFNHSRSFLEDLSLKS
jgi:hypothetical protein